MRCSESKILLATRRDLTAAQESAAQAHLAGCQDCAAQWSREERTSRVLRALPLPVAEPPRRVSVGVQQLLARTRYRSRRWSYGLVLAGAVLGALALFVALRPELISPFLSTSGQAEQPQHSPPAAIPPQQTTDPASKGDHNWYIISEVIRLHEMDGMGDEIKIVDPDTQQELGSLEKSFQAILAPDESRMYIASENGLAAIDTATKRELWHTPVDMRYWWLMAISPDGNWLYTVNTDPQPVPTDWLKVVNAHTGEFQGEQILLREPTPLSYYGYNVVSPRTGDMLYLLYSSQLWTLNTRTQQLAKFAPLSPEQMPPEDSIADIAVSPDGRILYLLVREEGIIVIDLEQHSITKRVPIANPSPDLIRWYPATMTLSGDGSTLMLSAEANVEGPDPWQDYDYEVLIFDTRTMQQRSRFILEQTQASPRIKTNFDGSSMYFLTAEGEHAFAANTVVELDSTNGQIKRRYKTPLDEAFIGLVLAP